MLCTLGSTSTAPHEHHDSRALAIAEKGLSCFIFLPTFATNHYQR